MRLGVVNDWAPAEVKGSRERLREGQAFRSAFFPARKGWANLCRTYGAGWVRGLSLRSVGTACLGDDEFAHPLLKNAKAWGTRKFNSQAQLAEILDEYQPRISDLLTGKVSKFTLDPLFLYSERLKYVKSTAKRESTHG
jgi:hypothetical protein